MSRYFKGTSIEDGRRAIFELYDEPKVDILSNFHHEEGAKVKTNVIEASFVETTGIRRFESVDDCKKKFNIQREIGEAEYTLYKNIQCVVEEMFLHDFSGGFPRNENVIRIASCFKATAMDALNGINCN